MGKGMNKRKIDSDGFMKILLLLIIFGFALRVFMLDSKPFWFDEHYSVEIAKPPLAETFKKMIEGDSSEYPQAYYTPPLYYILLHYSLGISESVFFTRFLFSCIPGVLLILATFALARVLFDEKTALLSAALVTIAPLSIVISQLARPYTLHTLFTLLSLLFFYISMNRNRKWMWVGYVIVNLLNIYLHYYGFFIILSEVLYFFMFMSKKEDVKANLLFSLAIITLLYLPWGYVLLKQVTKFAPPPAHLTRTTPLQLILYSIFKLSVGIRRPTLLDWRIVATIVIPVFYYAFFHCVYTSVRDRNEGGLMLLTAILVPLFIPIVIKQVTSQLILNSRYLWFLNPILLIFVSQGICAQNRRIQIFFSVFLFLTYLFLLYDYYFLIDMKNWSFLVGV